MTFSKKVKISEAPSPLSTTIKLWSEPNNWTYLPVINALGLLKNVNNEVNILM